MPCRFLFVAKSSGFNNNNKKNTYLSKAAHNIESEDKTNFVVVVIFQLSLLHLVFPQFQQIKSVQSQMLFGCVL